jgi:hypothetical protein
VLILIRRLLKKARTEQELALLKVILGAGAMDFEPSINQLKDFARPHGACNGPDLQKSLSGSFLPAIPNAT